MFMRARLVAGLIVVMSLAESAHADTVLNFSNWLSPTNTLMTNGFAKWCDDVRKGTEGRVRCNVLPKAVVAPTQTFDAIRDGIADVSFTVAGYTPGRFELTKVAEFPFLGDTAEAASAAYQRIHERYLSKYDEYKGVKVLAVFNHGPGHAYNTKRPIQSMKDFQGLKIRVGGGLVNQVADAIGTTSLLKPAPETYELLSSGVVDGVFFPKDSAFNFRFAPLVKHMTVFPGGLYNIAFAVIVNPAKWNTISAKDQEIIEKLSGERLARLLGRVYDDSDKIGFQAVKDAGAQIITASPAFVEEIRVATAPLEKAWIEAVRAKIGADATEWLKAIRIEADVAARQ
jgi:TRAP-type C4-dicarboxylate transport system substrate-binding protein